MKSLILLSGGLDSASVLSLDHCISLALTFDYGQRPVQKEVGSARQLAAHFGIRHQVIELPWFSSYSMTKEFPMMELAQLDNAIATRKSADAVWVPNRNGIFLEIAAGIAEQGGFSKIMVGFNLEEAATFADNSEEYLLAINKALRFSTRGRVQVVSPTLAWDKRQIVASIKQKDFPWKYLWSCYDNQVKMCGRCESCQRLKRALLLNEVPVESLFIDARIR